MGMPDAEGGRDALLVVVRVGERSGAAAHAGPAASGIEDQKGRDEVAGRPESAARKIAGWKRVLGDGGPGSGAELRARAEISDAGSGHQGNHEGRVAAVDVGVRSAGQGPDH